MQEQNTANRVTRSGLSIRKFALLLIGVSSVTWMGTSIYIPALSIIESDLGLNATQMGTTLTIYYIVYALLMPLVGPLSDSLGRRVFLLLGSLLFLAGSISCGLSDGVSTLYIGRGLQGAGAGMLQVPVMAMVSDECSGEVMYRILGILGALTGIIPALSMILGGALAQYGSWRMIFSFLAVISLVTTVLCWLYLKESLPQERRTKASGIISVIMGYRSMLFSRQMLTVGGPLIISATALGAFYTTAPFIVSDTFQLSSVYLGVVNILFVASAAAGQYLSSNAIKRCSASTVYVIGGIIALLGGCSFAGLHVVSALNTMLMLVVPVALFAFSFGFMEPAGLKSILTSFHANSGMASALYGSLLLAMQGLGSQVAGTLMHLPSPPITTLVLIMTPVALLMGITAITARGNLR
ncbi:MFS transporter [Desulfovibrio inopinatus]|uniref:MFS transporter n=1 Tax=Desulfovibrio inopinatus TaxID=102109 RepID=UPI00040B4C02|nr:MFS transporter [Desulfovibrio inopinatus]